MFGETLGVEQRCRQTIFSQLSFDNRQFLRLRSKINRDLFISVYRCCDQFG